MISYSASQDPFHSIFRILCILEASPAEYEVDRIYIYDFYVCFPWLIDGFKASRDVAGLVKTKNTVIRAYPKNDYRLALDARTMLAKMRSSQLAAVNTLVSFGIIDARLWTSASVVMRTALTLPMKLHALVLSKIRDDAMLFEFLSLCNQVPLLGANGLKDRTGIVEFRYDYLQA